MRDYSPVGEPVEPLRGLRAAASVDLSGEPVRRDDLAGAEEDSPDFP